MQTYLRPFRAFNLKDTLQKRRDYFPREEEVIARIESTNCFNNLPDNQTVQGYFEEQLGEVLTYLKETNSGVTSTMEILQLCFWVAENQPDLLNALTTYHLTSSNEAITFIHPHGYRVALQTFIQQLFPKES